MNDGCAYQRCSSMGHDARTLLVYIGMWKDVKIIEWKIPSINDVKSDACFDYQ